MRAVNLVPPDERRGAGGAAGRSGGAAYVLLGLLAALVIVVTLNTLSGRSLEEKRSELAAVEAQAAAGEARAAELAAFSQFSALRVKRVQTVTQLAASRFDFAHAVREVARVIPADTWLTGMQGTVSPGVQPKGSIGASTSGLRGALPVPALEMVGCTTKQELVARMMTRMRLIDGVTRVALQSSVKNDPSGGGAGAPAGGGGGGGGDCRQGNDKFPQFALVVFFDQVTGAVPVTATPGRSTVGATGPTGPTGTTGPATPVPGATP